MSDLQIQQKDKVTRVPHSTSDIEIWASQPLHVTHPRKKKKNNQKKTIKEDISYLLLKKCIFFQPVMLLYWRLFPFQITAPIHDFHRSLSRGSSESKSSILSSRFVSPMEFTLGNLSNLQMNPKKKIVVFIDVHFINEKFCWNKRIHIIDIIECSISYSFSLKLETILRNVSQLSVLKPFSDSSGSTLIY